MNIAPTRTLLLVNLLALAGLAYLWVDEHGHVRNISWVAPAPIKPVISTASTFDQSTLNNDPTLFAATLQRPLFAPDRRPPPPVLPPPPPPPPDPLADARLVGLIAGEAGGVLINAEGKTRRINLTQKLGEWTLQAVADRNATFARGDETRVMRMEYARLGAPAPVATRPANPTTGGLAGMPNNMIENARRAAEEDAAKNRDLEAMRARMSQKKP